MRTDLSLLCVRQESSLQEAIAQMDRNREGIILIVDEQGHLVGTVTDGDVRRAMLNRLGLEQPVSVVLARKAGTAHAKPITVPATADAATCLEILQQYRIFQLPVVDQEQRVIGLVTLDEFIPEHPLPLHAVVMAGGMGSRLRPLTQELPKPMLEVGGRPLLEIIIQHLRDAGIRQVKVTMHHKPERIEQHFGDGSTFGVELSYVSEDQPLGTAGGLGLLEVPKETTLVINGDILTQINFRSMLAFHREHQADLTVAVRHYELQVPYGVIECEGAMVRRVSEKPVMGFFVNAGIYLLEPVVYRYIPNGERVDMTDVIQRLVEAGRAVVSFPVREYWLDIGQIREYEQAEQDLRAGKVSV
jgi:dTDP-glucose pyrophosphorylase/CBS domain-containing protein